MPCSKCPHCQLAGQRRQMLLPDPPRNRGAAGPDVAFYTAFGHAYDTARAVFPQPMRELRQVNPWLSASQCREYLRRARAMGVVQTPVRRTGVQDAPDGAAAGQVAGGSGALVTTADPPPDDLLQLADDLAVSNWTATGRLVTLSQVRTAVPGKRTDTELRALMDRAVADGFAEHGHLPDSIRFPRR